ncbi:hypothetical protein PR048_004371 [Dryococelus australis]|uniref:Uncharacterized protein n=1 Tax=Dryococelus australis TaxID=614101 RepID=A0ABQ9I5R3_9NEOP|nr:hypothetical protein PR048_004371 [Dryococelus australis]
MRVIEVNVERRRNEGAGEIPTCENPMTRPGIEAGSPWWEASVLIAQPSWPPMYTGRERERERKHRGPRAAVPTNWKSRQQTCRVYRAQLKTLDVRASLRSIFRPPALHHSSFQVEFQHRVRQRSGTHTPAGFGSRSGHPDNNEVKWLRTYCELQPNIPAICGETSPTYQLLEKLSRCTAARKNKDPRCCSGHTTCLPSGRTGFDSRRSRSTDFRTWESCWAMPPVGGGGGVLRDLPFARVLHSGAARHSPHFTFIGSRELGINTKSLHSLSLREPQQNFDSVYRLFTVKIGGPNVTSHKPSLVFFSSSSFSHTPLLVHDRTPFQETGSHVPPEGKIITPWQSRPLLFWTEAPLRWPNTYRARAADVAVCLRVFSGYFRFLHLRLVSTLTWRALETSRPNPNPLGATVAERLARSPPPPPKAIRVQSPAGSLQFFACGIRAGRCRWSAGFLGDLPVSPPFHSGFAPYSSQSPSSVLKNSMLRAFQISLTHSTRLHPRHSRSLVSFYPAARKESVSFFSIILPRLALESAGRKRTLQRCVRQAEQARTAYGRIHRLRRQSRSQSEGAVAASVAPSWFETRSKIGLRFDIENCCTILVKSWTGDREVHFEPPKLANLDPRSAAIVDKCRNKIHDSEIQNHEISLVQHFYIGTKIKLDPSSELGSFDLGSGKMFVQPGKVPNPRLSVAESLMGIRLECTPMSATGPRLTRARRRTMVARRLVAREHNVGQICAVNGRHQCEACFHGQVGAVSWKLKHIFPKVPARRAAPTSTLWTTGLLSSAGYEKSLANRGHGGSERLACSPPTKAIRVQSPAGATPDSRAWEPCRTMPLVGGTCRGSPASPALSFRRCSMLISETLVGSRTSMLRAIHSSSLRFNSFAVRVIRRIRAFFLQKKDVPLKNEDKAISFIPENHTSLFFYAWSKKLKNVLITARNPAGSETRSPFARRLVTLPRPSDVSECRTWLHLLDSATIALNFTVLYTREPASFLHWLLRKRESTPFVTTLHLIGRINCEVFTYWRRAIQGVVSHLGGQLRRRRPEESCSRHFFPCGSSATSIPDNPPRRVTSEAYGAEDSGEMQKQKAKGGGHP